MSELLLQSILEKLRMIESLLKQGIADKDETNQNQWAGQLQGIRADLKKMIEQFLLMQEKMSELKLKIEAIGKKLEQPLQNRVEHKHHLHKGIWIAIILFLGSVFFLWQWMNATQEKKQFEANDIKYRALKVTAGGGLLKLLYHADSLYSLDAQHMQKWVVQEEERLVEQTKMFRLAGEKKEKPRN